MSQIVLEPQNPLDLTPEELQDLAESLRRLDPGYEVRIAGEGFAGAGVTLVEVLFIWLPAIGQTLGPLVAGKILDLTVDWARQRIRRDASNRSRAIDILGPDGKVIKSVRVKDVASEAEDSTSETKWAPPRKFPQ